MTERIDRLTQLLKMKEETTEKAYQEWLQAQEQFKHNKTRHEQLVVYRQDYLTQLEQLGQDGTQVGRIRNRIDFINHLDTALVQLNNHLSQLAKNRSRCELIYKETKASEEAVRKLIERANKTEQVKMQRIEQKESDEYAQKQWYSKHLNDHSNTFGE